MEKHIQKLFSISNLKWKILIGHAIHVAWGWLMFTGSLFTDPGNDLINSPLLPDPLYMLSLGANAATLILFALLGRSIFSLFRHEWVALVAALFMSIGTFFASDLVLLLFGNPTVLVEILAGIMTGFGTGMFLLIWGEVFVSLGTRRCLFYFSVSSFLAAFGHIVLSHFPEIWIQGVVVIAPLIELGLYRMYISENRLMMPKGNDRHETPRSLPLNVLILGAFFGFSFGFMRGFSFVLEQIGLRDSATTASMVFVMVACILVLFVTFVNKQNFGKLTYQITLPFIALGFFMLPFQDMWSFIDIAMYRIGYQYAYVILWVLWVFFACRPDTTSVWVIACGLTSVQVSKLVGFAITVDVPVITGMQWDSSIVSSTALFLVVLFSLFARENQVDEKSWEQVRPVAERTNDFFFVSKNYEPAAVAFGLSPRESDVFYLLLRGRSRSHIAKALVITEETVKTHVKSIYQKAGVHTKQDLIDRVEDMIKSENN